MTQKLLDVMYPPALVQKQICCGCGEPIRTCGKGSKHPSNSSGETST